MAKCSLDRQDVSELTDAVFRTGARDFTLHVTPAPDDAFQASIASLCHKMAGTVWTPQADPWYLFVPLSL
jgi:hypothetical protein